MELSHPLHVTIQACIKKKNLEKSGLNYYRPIFKFPFLTKILGEKKRKKFSA